MKHPRTKHARQRWVVTDARGVPLSTVYTCGCHPCHERGEPPVNVMRTHRVDEAFDSAAQVFARAEKVFMVPPERLAETAHRAILTRFADPLTLARALANGLSKADRAALKAAFQWLDLKEKD